MITLKLYNTLKRLRVCVILLLLFCDSCSVPLGVGSLLVTVLKYIPIPRLGKVNGPITIFSANLNTPKSNSNKQILVILSFIGI